MNKVIMKIRKEKRIKIKLINNLQNKENLKRILLYKIQ